MHAPAAVENSFRLKPPARVGQNGTAHSASRPLGGFASARPHPADRGRRQCIRRDRGRSSRVGEKTHIVSSPGSRRDRAAPDCAAAQPSIAVVPGKSAEQRAAAMQLSVREMLVRQRTQLVTSSHPLDHRRRPHTHGRVASRARRAAPRVLSAGPHPISREQGRSPRNPGLSGQPRRPAPRPYVLGEIIAAFRLLASHPEAARLRRDLTSLPLKFWPVFSYLIVYDPAARPLAIVRVLHGRRDVAARPALGFAGQADRPTARGSSRVRARAPFRIDAWVVLPDHTHCLWTLPPGDDDFPGRWRAIKIVFAKAIPAAEPRRARHLAARYRRAAVRVHGEAMQATKV